MWQMSKTNNRIMLFFLFLFAIGFMGKPTYVILFAGLFLLISSKRGISINKGFFSISMLVLFSFFCIAFGSSISLTTGMKSLCCISAFFVGSQICLAKKDSFKRILIFLAFAFALYPVMNMLYEIAVFGFNFSFLNSTTHFDIWTRQDSAVTLIISNSCLITSLFAFILFRVNKPYIIIFGLILVFLSTIYDLILGGRTFLLLMVIMFLIGTLLVLFFTKNGVRRIVWRLLVILSIVSIIIFFLFFFLNGFKEFLDSFFGQTHFFWRFFENDQTSEFLKTSRWDIRNQYFSLFWSNLFGGHAIYNQVGMMPHELWLDIYDIAGIFAYVPFILYFIASVTHILKFCLSHKIDIDTRIVVACCSIGLILQFLVEPVFSGNPSLLFVYCFIDGAVVNFLSVQQPRQMAPRSF